jgi:hypothetical protein
MQAESFPTSHRFPAVAKENGALRRTRVMSPHSDCYAKLSYALEAARQAFVRGSAADAAYAIADAAEWARLVGNPWAGELADLAEALGPAARAVRDAADKFMALFPDFHDDNYDDCV